ncbi:MAG: DUF1501 domain-containing protein [Myxococcota bacterium]
MPLSRRQLLASAGAVTAAGMLPRWAFADGTTPTDPDRYFVFAYFFGGWDVLLALDPRDPDTFNEDRLAETGILPAYDQQDAALGAQPLIETGIDGMVFGPYIGELARHADKMAVIRGMAMGTVAHTTGQRHANTGRLPAGNTVRGSSMGTILASLLASDETIPNLTVGVESFNLDHPQWAGAVGANNANDLVDSLSPGQVTLAAAERDALERFFADERAATRRPWVQNALANRKTSRLLIEQEIAELFDVNQDSVQMNILRDRFGINDGSTGVGGSRALIAAQALTNGVSRCVSFRAANNLDSHNGDEWRGDHGPRIQSGYNAVAALIDSLAATPYKNTPDSWLDHTTIVLQSEFCRTPNLNSRGGRDHHITNSCVLIGAGIKGGQVIGATSDFKLGAQAVDLSSGQLTSGGEFIENEHISRSLLHSIGVTEDVADFRTPALLAALR